MKTKTRITTFIATLLISGAAVSTASAADPVRGKMLYFSTNGAALSCGSSGCHAPDPTTNPNNVKKGTTGAAILTAINSVSVMTAFVGGKVTAVDADDIAAYIVNPAAGTPSPAATLSAASLSFGNQLLQTTSGTMSASLQNTGSANLVLSSVTLAGTNPSDFARAGTCAPAVTLAPTQSCSIDVTFKPSALGARAATITVGHNASPATSILNLTGSGMSAPAPATALSATSIAFGNQTIGVTSSPPRTVSISNTGTASLVLGTITTTGTAAADFAASKCSGTSLAPGASCTIDVTFTPAALTARSATLSIPSNATGSPHGVALSGTGVAAPAAAVSVSPAILAFGNQTTGTASAKSIGLTNSGNASLQITSIGTTSSGFALKHNCPATLAASASCSIDVTFAPTSATAYSGTVAIVSTAAGSPHSVGLSGTGTAPVVLAPQVTLSPLALDFGTLPLNTPSGKRAVSLTNSGNGPLSLAGIAVAGANAADFSQTHNCPVAGALAAGSSCTITLGFTPTVAGARAASLTVSSNAPGAPAVDLKGTGVVQAAALAQVAPMQIAFGSVRIGKTSDERNVRIRNTGTTPLVIGAVTATTDYLVKNECKPTLPAGEACEVKVRFKPTALGSRQGELTVASNAAGSPHAVKLSGTGATQRPKDDADECDDDSSCPQATLPFGPRRR